MTAQPRQGLPPRRTKTNWTPYILVGGALAIGFVIFAGMVGVLLLFAASKDRLPSGVRVAGIDIGGKSVEDATAYLQQNISSQMITVTDGTRSFPLRMSDLGVTVDVNATMNAVEQAREDSDVQPLYNIDLNQAQSGLITLSEQVNVDAVPGNPPQVGRSVDIPVVLDRLRLDVTGELADRTLDLNMFEVQPPEPEPETVTADNYTGATTTHVVQSGQELALIAREYGVDMADIVALNGIEDPNLLWVGQELIIPAGGVYQPSAADAPPAPTGRGKEIVVSTDNQRVFAYENGQLIRSHLTSTGLPATPTVKGDFKIYVKYVADDMAGADYFLPQVPYVMYFYQGYGIHGTYWHNAFGRPMSHGCVNLPVDEAQWWFNWAEVGTPVRVI